MPSEHPLHSIQRPMAQPTTHADSEHTIPEGYTALALNARFESSPITPCLIVRNEPDPAGGRLVVLRSVPFGRVLLGALLDSSGALCEPVEIWVQDASTGDARPPLAGRSPTQADVDRIWSESLGAARSTCPSSVIDIGFEDDRLPACALRPDPLSIAPLPEQGEAPPDDSEPINPAPALVHARRFHPVSLDALLRVYEGETWAGVFHGSALLPFAGSLRKISQSAVVEPVEGGHLLLSRRDVSSRLSEVVHLKLRMLADAIEEVAAAVESTKGPLFAIDLDSFRVDLSRPGTGVPYLWSARARLATTGDALEVSLDGSERRQFISASGDTTSIFRPESATPPAAGGAVLRIREVIEQGDDTVVIDATASTPERVSLAEHDLLWLKPTLGSGPVDLYFRLEEGRTLAEGESRIRSLPLNADQNARSTFRALAGVPIAEVPLRVLPQRSSPCDLYALGVIATRAFFADQQQTLPVALDQVMSLARRAGEAGAPETALVDRISAVFESDPRWLESLGPHRIVSEELSAPEALRGIPFQLWVDILATVCRMFPGLSPDSSCRSLGDAPAHAPHRVFDTAKRDLNRLLVCSRSLIVVDWESNREVHSLIRDHMTGLADARSAAGAAESASS